MRCFVKVKSLFLMKPQPRWTWKLMNLFNKRFGGSLLTARFSLLLTGSTPSWITIGKSLLPVCMDPAVVQIKRLEIFKDILLKRRPKISLFVGISYTLSGSLSMKALTNIPASRRKFTREVALFVGCAISGQERFLIARNRTSEYILC